MAIPKASEMSSVFNQVAKAALSFLSEMALQLKKINLDIDFLKVMGYIE